MKLTSKQAAKILGVAPSTISRWIKSGLLPAERQGRFLIIENLEVILEQFERPKLGRPSSGELTLARDVNGHAIHAVRNGRGLCGWKAQWVRSSAELPTCKRCSERFRN